MNVQRFEPWLCMVGIAVLLTVPGLADNYHLHVLSVMCIFVVVAVGMNILVGYTGLVSLGHAGLFAIGAYTSALLSTRAGVPLGWAALAGSCSPPLQAPFSPRPHSALGALPWPW